MLKKSLFLVPFIVLLSVIKASALVLDTDVWNLDFKINNPGARANAMGGAFTGVADDATAALANPAGLSVLTAPEVSVEYKNTGQTSNIITGTGTSKEIDDRTYGVSFISYVHPKDNATFAVYRHQLMNIETEFPLGTASNKVDIESSMLGVGMGFKLSESFSLGASFGFAELDYFFKAENAANFIHLTDGHDNADYYSASLLWSPLDSFNLGLVYSYGPEFTTQTTIWAWDGTGAFLLTDTLENTLKIPDVYSLGISFRLFSSLTLAIDANHVMYTQLKDNLKALPIHGQATVNETKIDDEQEYHAGLEYVFTVGSTPMALRCGYYFRPDHKFVYTGNNPALTDFIQEGEDDHIYSGGIGFVASEKVQIDIAASIGEFTDEYILSMVYRF